MNSPFFTADNLRAGYGKKIILENICFSLEQGTVTGLLGANGSGIRQRAVHSGCDAKRHYGAGNGRACGGKSEIDWD